MFRFAMHALGGLGLIVVALSFGLFGRGGGASLFSSEGRSEHVVPNVVQTTQFIARITLVIVSVATVIITALCLFMGMEPTRAFLNALWVSTSGFVTGGFTPMQLSIMYYHSFPLEAILMVLMILGSISFVIHAEVWKGRPLPFFRDIETKTMVLWIGVMAFVFTATLALSPFDDMLALLRRGLFMIISAFTTTGFQVVTTNQITTAFSNGAFLTLAFIMAVGGASGSTAGGIKVNRLVLAGKMMRTRLRQQQHPNAIIRIRLDGVIQENEALHAVMIFIVTYLMFILAGTVFGTMLGVDLTTSFTGAVASMGNVGPGFGEVGSMDNFSAMPAAFKVSNSLLMLLGRLEIFGLIQIFFIKWWR